MRTSKLLQLDELEDVKCDFCGDSRKAFSLERNIGLKVGECAKCGLAYVSPRPSSKYMFTYYRDMYAIENLEKLWDDYRKFDFTAPDIARMRKFMEIKGATVLDVGCGNGILLDALRRAGASDLVGIELSVKKAQMASRMVRKANIYVSSYEYVKLPERSFDLITAFDLIEHLYSPGEFFRFAARLLKPAGILYIKTPNWNAARHYGKYWEGLNQDAEHVYYFDRYSLENYFERVGILIEAVDYEPITAGLGRTRCTFETRLTVNFWGMMHSARNYLRSIPIISRLAYRMLYRLRRVKNREDIASGTAHELIAIGRKSHSGR